jgi:hypothetical protein
MVMFGHDLSLRGVFRGLPMEPLDATAVDAGVEELLESGFPVEPLDATAVDAGRDCDATIAKLKREVRVLGNAKAANEMFRLRASAAIGHIDAGRLEQAKALLDADLDPAPRA